MNFSPHRENSIFEINITMTCSQMFLIYLISLVSLVNASNLFPLNAYTFSTSFFLVPLDIVYNQI